MKKSILILALSLVYFQVNAQRIKQVSLAVVNENIAFPFTTYSPLHPGVEGGLTLWQNEKDHSIREFNTYLGWFYHEKVENAIYLRGEYMHRFKVKDFLSIDFSGSAGYLHTFYPGPLYKINPESGEILEAGQVGRPHLMAGFGLGLTYKNQSRFEPFIRQEISIETPFAAGAPILVHSFLKIGLIMKLPRGDKF